MPQRKTFDAVDPQGSHNYDNLVAEHGLIAPQELRPEVVVNMSNEDIRYMGPFAAVVRILQSLASVYPPFTV